MQCAMIELKWEHNRHNNGNKSRRRMKQWESRSVDDDDAVPENYHQVFCFSRVLQFVWFFRGIVLQIIVIMMIMELVLHEK